MKDLKSLTKEELNVFYNSFDLVLTDVDGVLWHFLETIPGSEEAIKSLNKMGKKVYVVSNNSTKTIDLYYNQLTSAGFNIKKDEIITPTLAIISHLKKIKFDKKIFVIGMSSLRMELKSAGFNLTESGVTEVKETIKDLTDSTAIDDNVGAVIIDIDINLNYVKLQKAVNFLKNPKVLFLTGPTDKKVPVGKNHILIGPGYFHKIVEEITGRKSIAMAKPSVHLNEFVHEKLEIKDPSRVLFIGDSIQEDMGFATNSGYKKLLVFSGLTKKEVLSDWTFPDEYKPDYYVDSLKILDELIQK